VPIAPVERKLAAILAADMDRLITAPPRPDLQPCWRQRVAISPVITSNRPTRQPR